MPGPISEEQIAAVLAKDPIPEAKDARIHHTALRVKDPLTSLDFYRRIFGMRLQNRKDLPHYETTVYFMGYGTPENNPPNSVQDWKDVAIELFHIWGSESKPEFQYVNGNDSPKGFGHLALSVPDVFAFAKRIEAMGIQFIKKPDEGSPKGQAFLQDPDGYYIEVISELKAVPGLTNPQKYNDMFKM